MRSLRICGFAFPVMCLVAGLVVFFFAGCSNGEVSLLGSGSNGSDRSNHSVDASKAVEIDVEPVV